MRLVVASVQPYLSPIEKKKELCHAGKPKVKATKKFIQYPFAKNSMLFCKDFKRKWK